MGAEGSSGYTVGIDTGGTFTDLVAFDPVTGAMTTFKTPSVPSNPGQALIDAIGGSGIGYGDIASLVHGTTVATNALIERKGARVAFLVTSGHEDIPYIQRINRKTLYDLRWRKPIPLLKNRRDSLGVHERLSSRGEELIPLDEAQIVGLCAQIRERDIEAVAICLLFSYVNPAHEMAVKQIIERELPGLPCSRMKRRSAR